MALTNNQKEWRRDTILKANNRRPTVAIWEYYFAMNETELQAARDADKQAKIESRQAQKTNNASDSDRLQAEIDALTNEEV
jgi:hypothetical protein